MSAQSEKTLWLVATERPRAKALLAKLEDTFETSLVSPGSIVDATTLPTALLVDFELPGLLPAKVLYALTAHDHLPLLGAVASSFELGPLARGLQLGIQLLSDWEGAELLSELSLAQRGQPCPSRAKALATYGGRLLREDERLWSVEGELPWRARLLERAQALRLRSNPSDRVAFLLDALDQTGERPLDVITAEALLKMSLEGVRKTEETARAFDLGATRLRRFYRRSVEVLAACGARTRQEIEPALREALTEARRRQDAPRAPAQRAARLAGAELLLAELDEELSQAGQLLLARCAELLEVELTEVEALDPPLDTLARQLVGEDDPNLMTGKVALVLLGRALQGLDGPTATPERFALVGRLLGCGMLLDDHPQRLIAAAASTEDPAIIATLVRAPLDGINRTLAKQAATGAGVTINPVEAARRLETLFSALLPGGEVTRRRIADLVDVIERGGVTHISAPTRRAALLSLGLPPQLRGTEVTLLWQALGVLELSQEARVKSFLSEFPSSADFTTEDLYELIKASKSIEALAAFQQELLSRASPDVALDQQERAEAESHQVALIEELGLPPRALCHLSTEQISGALRLAGLSPELSRRRSERVALFITAVNEAETDEHKALLLKHFAVTFADNHPMLALAFARLEEAGAEGPKVALRVAVGLPSALATPKHAQNLLNQGRLAAARLAVAELEDTDPRTVPLLNRLATTLEHAGEYAQAEALLTRALSLQPQRANLLLNLARVLTAQGRRGEAIPLLEQVREIAPEMSPN